MNFLTLGETKDIHTLLEALTTVQKQGRVSVAPIVVLNEDGDAMGTIEFNGDVEGYVFEIDENSGSTQ